MIGSWVLYNGTRLGSSGLGFEIQLKMRGLVGPTGGGHVPRAEGRSGRSAAEDPVCS